jgi:hypothetical protein
MAAPGDPFEFVVDAPLFVVPQVRRQLRDWRDGPKLADLPGENPSPERERLALELVRLADRLLEGIEAHPTKFWVLKQFQQSLETLRDEDTEALEHVGNELERLMDIVGIADSDGVLAYYLAQPGA